MKVGLIRNIALVGALSLCIAATPVYAKDKKGNDELQGDAFSVSAVPGGDLEKKRGGELIEAELTGAMLDAVSSNNVTIGGSTGSNVIGHDAFGHADGVTSVIQNSGNNVVIQSATVVNLKLAN